MVLILVALIVACIVSTIALKVVYSDGIVYAFAILLCCCILGLLVYASLGWEYFAAEHKAKLINEEYGTNYTQEEVFYASDIINIINAR